MLRKYFSELCPGGVNSCRVLERVRKDCGNLLHPLRCDDASYLLKKKSLSRPRHKISKTIKRVCLCSSLWLSPEVEKDSYYK